MNMITIEFPADRSDIARHMGAALTAIGSRTELVAAEPIAGTIETAEPGATETTELTADVGSDDNGQFSKEETEEGNDLTERSKVDTKGVPYHPDFCGKAAKPFYASGARGGQWKKRQGVDDEDYDAWYAAELATISGSTGDTESTVNTGDAFGAGCGEQGHATPVVPHDAGALMAWVSEMQGADRLNQGQVNAAYEQAGFGMQKIFPSPENTSEIIAERVGLLHSILSVWAGEA